MIVLEQYIPMLKALSDETRLRIMGILAQSSLSVNELIQVLDMGQSRISRHLKILLEAGLLTNRRDGAKIFYKISHPQNLVYQNILLSFGILNNISLNENESENHKQNKTENLLLDDLDAKKINEVLNERKRATIDHFQNYDRNQDEMQSFWVDSNFYMNMIMEIIPVTGGIAADLGCGAGILAKKLLNKFEKIICVDQSKNMLDLAKSNLKSEKGDFRIGSIEHLPMRDGEANTVILSMALHHIADFHSALKEANRVLSKKGTLIIADIKKHNEEIMREKYADFYLGFDTDELKNEIKSVDFEIKEERSGIGNGRLESFCIALVKN